MYTQLEKGENLQIRSAAGWMSIDGLGNGLGFQFFTEIHALQLRQKDGSVKMFLFSKAVPVPDRVVEGFWADAKIVWESP